MRIAPATAILVFLLAGCGEDSAGPEPPRTIRFPGDFATLQEAVDAAGPGETVEIAVGTHALDARVVVGGSGIRIAGASAGPLRGNTAAVLEVSLLADDESGIAILVEGTGVTIENLEIRGSFLHGVAFVQRDGVLRGCRIEGGRSYSVWCPNPLSDPLIEGNVIVRAGVFGVSCQGGASPVVERNTIVEAGDCGIYSADSTPTCRRNIVYDAVTYGVACFGPSNPTLECNDVFGTLSGVDWSPKCTPGASDLNLDPLFCGDGTYRLRPDSPCTAENAAGCGGMGATDEICPAAAD